MLLFVLSMHSTGGIFLHIAPLSWFTMSACWLSEDGSVSGNKWPLKYKLGNFHHLGWEFASDPGHQMPHIHQPGHSGWTSGPQISWLPDVEWVCLRPPPLRPVFLVSGIHSHDWPPQPYVQFHFPKGWFCFSSLNVAPDSNEKDHWFGVHTVLKCLNCLDFKVGSDRQIQSPQNDQKVRQSAVSNSGNSYLYDHRSCVLCIRSHTCTQ